MTAKNIDLEELLVSYVERMKEIISEDSSDSEYSLEESDMITSFKCENLGGLEDQLKESVSERITEKKDKDIIVLKNTLSEGRNDYEEENDQFCEFTPDRAEWDEWVRSEMYSEVGSNEYLESLIVLDYISNFDTHSKVNIHGENSIENCGSKRTSRMNRYCDSSITEDVNSNKINKELPDILVEEINSMTEKNLHVEVSDPSYILTKVDIVFQATRVHIPKCEDEEIYFLQDSESSNEVKTISISDDCAIGDECVIDESMNPISNEIVDEESNVEVIFDVTKVHPTYYIHWFPTSPNNFDKLYDENGPLHRYDQAFGTTSKEYELSHNVKMNDWEGHCDKSAIVVSILKKPPVNRVTVNGIVFRPYDIKGLLVKVIQCIPMKMEWIGRRYPDGPKSDPNPIELRDKLKAWSSRGRPFILDTDAGYPVWNWAYDKVTIDYENRIMNFTSTGFPEENRRYLVDWNLDAWIRELNFDESKNPDFAWMVTPECDVMDIMNWPEVNTAKTTSLFNPHVSPRKVFELYLKSIKENNNEV